MKWFSIQGIVSELKKIRWAKKEDLLHNSVQVIIFIIFFALFFYLCQFVVSLSLNLIGVIG